MTIRTSDQHAGGHAHGLDRVRERGQALVMFTAAIVFFVGFLAIVVDVTWYWANTLKVQRAADAAALAGAVKLPDYPTQARTLAFAEATKNGYTTGVGGVTVTAAQNPTRDIQLDTSVSAPVDTFFMRLFGIGTLTATARSAAEYVLPVPMGSPLNYFGAYGAIRGWIHTDTGWRYPTTTLTSYGVADTWTTPANAFVDEAPAPPAYATTVGKSSGPPPTPPTNLQGYANFHVSMPGPASDYRFLVDGGIEVKVRARSTGTGCTIAAEVSPNASAGASASWYGLTSAHGNNAALTGTDTDLIIGGSGSTSGTDTGDWWGGTASGSPSAYWTAAKFADGAFAVRLRVQGAGSSCTTGTTSVDSVAVRISYEQHDQPITGPNGESLTAQGVWTGVLSQGSDVGNGDAYQAQKNGSGTSTMYSPGGYYDYAIEMPAGATDGKVWIFDPVFCATGGFSNGMGDVVYGGASATSTFFDIYDTKNTLYDASDDTWIAGNTGPAGAANPDYGLFRQSKGYDPSQSGASHGSGWSTCQRGKVTNPAVGGYWHNRWWPLATGLSGPSSGQPRIYRIHVTSTDPYAPSDQASTKTLNNFSFFTSPTGGAPRVYGLGSMVAFSPLPRGSAVDLYLAQIGPAYAGKTMKVSLWDPGDTNTLSATLQFLQPTATGFTPASFTWTASKFAVNGTNCNGSSGGSVTSVVTNTGGSSKFNGCWLIISIPIPTTYVAPTPPGVPGAGWWKIRYTMGSGTTDASDLTTWKTQMIGNPVHLVTP